MRVRKSTPVGKLCGGHSRGFSPTQPRPFTQGCRMCVQLFGHLPPDQRDRPPQHPNVTPFTNRRPAASLDAQLD